MKPSSVSTRTRLVQHVQELERLEEAKRKVADALRDRMRCAQDDGFDGPTLKAILKLRKMTPAQRKERRALEAIYLASLGMLDGDPLPDEARRRLDGQPPAADPPEPDEKPTSDDPAPPGDSQGPGGDPAAHEGTPPTPPKQVEMPLRTPAEAREEGRAAAGAGKKVYENPYPAGDPCRAAWDEGWCESSGSHGLDIPSAFQRKKKPPKGDEAPEGDDNSDKEE
ncbi:MAG: DUF2312 domain-containing protein [Vicinamibacteria bacterium]|nr:DUF2312 domain-containing protein [Vicinamibacteria bacterium]